MTCIKNLLLEIYGCIHFIVETKNNNQIKYENKVLKDNSFENIRCTKLCGL